MTPPLDHLVDAVAMWVEDRRRREPAGFRPCDAAPLGCFGALSPLSLAPPREGTWRAPSPRPSPGDPLMSVVARPARGPRRGTAVLVPPWKVSSLAAVAGYVRLATRAGLDVWTLVPPRHLERAAAARSGEAFVSPDLGALRAAVEQLVAELRVLTALARTQGGEVALVGLSLGALGAALAATAPEPVDRVALIAPPADLAAVFAETAIGRRYARLAERAGAPLPEPGALAALLAPLDPAARRPSARRVLVAVGREDRIALPAGALELARAWGAEVRVYPRGHLTLLFACRALRRDLLRFLVP
jgi:predicted alpha/beta hydrolase family esterase